jgi:hypothetical protein
VAPRTKTIIDLLRAACERPGMFTADGSLEPLETMCGGYEVALNNHGIDEVGREFNARFREFLLNEYGWSTAQGWALAIHRHTRSEAGRFKKLASLLNEFEKSDA